MNFKIVSRIIGLLAIIFLIENTTLCQDKTASDFKLSVKKEEASSSYSSDGKIILSVTSEERQKLKYMLYTKEPWKDGEKLKTSGFVYKQTFTFDGLNADKYFIAVRNKQKSTKATFVNLKSK